MGRGKISDPGISVLNKNELKEEGEEEEEEEKKTCRGVGMKG